MDDIYTDILEKALPFYRRRSAFHARRIQWLLGAAAEFVNESDVDIDLLMQYIILHDTGSADAPKVSKQRSERSAVLAERILKEQGFASEKIDLLKELIQKKYTWKSDDSMAEEPVMKIFSNLELLWKVSDEGFTYIKQKKKDATRAYYSIVQEVDDGLESKRLWYSDTMKKLFRDQLAKRRKEYNVQV
jgi:HD superfamily phosphodiesterase